MKKRIKSTIFSLAAITALATAAVTGKGLSGYAEEAQDSDKIDQEKEEDDGKIYCVGSVSKVYVVTAVMQLVEQGKVELDKPVTEYIDDFVMADEGYKDITVRMLMDHTSGLYGTTINDVFLYGDNKVDHARLTLDNLKTQKLKADPGAYASYCNDGFELLEIIVERVSGISYTEYIEKNIADRIGAVNIYTVENVFGNSKLSNIYSDRKNRYDTDYTTCLGSGGVYSTARDTCEFGSTFCKGDNRLLSEESKAMMAEVWSAGADTEYDKNYLDGNGLGWDLVSIPQYEEAGVQMLYKGGDSADYHTALLVAPEEEISVCVTTSGGSSGFNLAMAEALADIALSEQGIDIEAPAVPEITLQDTVPDSYKKFEGLYIISDMPAEVSFPDMKYMNVRFTVNGTTEEHYKYSDLGFIKVSGNMDEGTEMIDKDYACLDISEISGHTYVVMDTILKLSGLGDITDSRYVGERIEELHLSDKVMDAWKLRDGNKYELVSDKYSSALYNDPFILLNLIGDSGYIMLSESGETRILKIIDEDHAVRFLTIPSSTNRDQLDLWIEGETVHQTIGADGINSAVNPKFTADITEVETATGEAKWFDIDDTMAGAEISLERPENSAVFVYDKYGQMTYSTHMVDQGNRVTLQKGGSIVFLGEDGGTIKIK